MEAIILIGPPGAGKGTAAERVRVQAGYIHVSTGDMLRAAVKKGSALGVEADGYMKRGELVPDGLMIRLVEQRLREGAPTDKYMFDGFPRTIPQADLLDRTIQGLDGTLTHVFLLVAPREVLIQRLTGRRICRACGMNFHVVNVPPKKAGACDACGGELYQRPDDHEATICNRLDVYQKQTESLIARYERMGLLVRVDSSQSADRLVCEILSGLKNRPGGSAA
jgi:adenylate kinase